MPLYRETPPLPDEPIWRWILYVLVGAAIVSTVIAILADAVWALPALSSVATWSAIACLALYLFFRWLGHREAQKRAGRGGDGKP